MNPAFTTPPTAPYARGSESSKAAAEAVAPRLPNQRTRIWQYLCSLLPNGATGEQIEDHFDWHRSSVSTRLGELEEVGYVKRTGTFVPTSSGNTGEIYIGIPKDDPHPPMPKRKVTLRQAAQAVIKGVDDKDATAVKTAIARLRAVLKGEEIAS